MKSTNIPEVKLGIVAVSRDCFPIQLSEKRRAAIVAACQAKGLDPVSYTHLDVYKRQAIYPAVLWAVPAGGSAHYAVD